MNETLEFLELAIKFAEKARDKYIAAGEPDGLRTTGNMETSIAYLHEARISLLHP